MLSVQTKSGKRYRTQGAGIPQIQPHKGGETL